MKLIDLQEDHTYNDVSDWFAHGGRGAARANYDKKTGIYDGDLSLINQGLKSLKGCPKIINGNFDCSNNNLKSLEHGPREVGGDFNCSRNDLKSLEWAPAKIGGGGVLGLGGSFAIGLGGSIACGSNDIGSLKDIHKIILEIDGHFGLGDNPIKSNILGVLYIKGVKSIPVYGNGKAHDISDILNRYLKEPFGHKRVFECQCALQDANFDEYAKL